MGRQAMRKESEWLELEEGIYQGTPQKRWGKRNAICEDFVVAFFRFTGIDLLPDRIKVVLSDQPENQQSLKIGLKIESRYPYPDIMKWKLLDENPRHNSFVGGDTYYDAKEWVTEDFKLRKDRNRALWVTIYWEG
jgi:hypothetical protein